MSSRLENLETADLERPTSFAMSVFVVPMKLLNDFLFQLWLLGNINRKLTICNNRILTTLSDV